MDRIGIFPKSFPPEIFSQIKSQVQCKVISNCTLCILMWNREKLKIITIFFRIWKLHILTNLHFITFIKQRTEWQIKLKWKRVQDMKIVLEGVLDCVGSQNSIMVYSLGLQVQASRVQIPNKLSISWIKLDKRLSLSVPQFP